MSRPGLVAAGLAMASFLALGAPTAGRASRIVWVPMCDAAHPGRRIPLPARRDPAPPAACHAVAAAATDPRSRR